MTCKDQPVNTGSLGCIYFEKWRHRERITEREGEEVRKRERERERERESYKNQPTALRYILLP